MPDISMCLNKECKLRSNCYRYMALPSQYIQSYSEFIADDCEQYLPLSHEQYHIIKMAKRIENNEA